MSNVGQQLVRKPEYNTYPKVRYDRGLQYFFYPLWTHNRVQVPDIERCELTTEFLSAILPKYEERDIERLLTDLLNRNVKDIKQLHCAVLHPVRDFSPLADINDTDYFSLQYVVRCVYIKELIKMGRWGEAWKRLRLINANGVHLEAGMKPVINECSDYNQFME
eukprot:TRINITY_DN8021_c0_g1_i2.p1 TRINITY_DN8021_c0_g1~~TRINITY_DN8021_c0_g1_i2.p1  ORF type:complete len:164 (+),score=16.18 TRINITY_DN8021_c0_g1_i2:59-550(+)